MVWRPQRDSTPSGRWIFEGNSGLRRQLCNGRFSRRVVESQSEAFVDPFRDSLAAAV